MNITGLALKNNRVTILGLLVLIIMGSLEYSRLSRDSMPPFVVRTATIITQFPGASPERVESLISEKIETVLQEIPEMKTLASTSRTGVSIIKASVDDDVSESELQAIWDLCRRKIEGIKKDLPEGIYGPNLNDEDIGVVFGVVVGLQSDGFDYQELKKYADDLRDDIIALDDAAKVIIGGTVEEKIYLEYHEAQLAQAGLTSGQLQNIISSSNIIIPSGEVNLGKERIILEASGNFESVEAIENLLIPLGKSGETVPLGDLTKVHRKFEYPKEALVRINGEQALALYVSLKEGANIIDLGKEVNRLINHYNANVLPIGIDAKRVAAQDAEVQKKINDFVGNLLQSIVIVLIVVLLILGWRAGIVIASLVPLTMILTIYLMGLFNIGLNQVTLASLIMALGLLVDNGIVMVESLLEKLHDGQNGFQAAVNSAKEFMIPLLISSLTTSAAFLSFYLATGPLGEMMGNIFLVITIALLSSWLIAFTVIPLFGTALLKVTSVHEAETFFDRFRGFYNNTLGKAMQSPKRTLLLIVGFFILALYGFSHIPGTFMPPSDRNLVIVDINFPLGTKIEITDQKVAELEAYIKDSLLVQNESEQGVKDWSSYIGKGPEAYDLGYFPGEPMSSYAHMLINTSSGEINEEVIRRLRAFSNRTLLDAEVKINRLVGSGGAESPIEIRVSGKSPDELFRISERIKKQLYETPGIINVTDDWGPRIKKFYVNIDENRLSRAGLSNQDVALSLLTSLSGFDVGEYRDEDKSIPITLKREGSEELSYSDLENITIFSQQTGKSSPLSEVANIEVPWQYSRILRRDLKRSMTIQAGVANGFLSSAIMDETIRPFMDEEIKNWPNAYTLEYGGDAEGSSNAMGAVVQNLPLSFFIIILLLVVQFNSFRKATIILLTIPLAIVGVTTGLLIANSVFSFTAFLGVISLAGIIINDAIVLLDKFGSERASGKGLMDSIKKAANDRFSPILLTTLTTSCGMIPLWTGGGELWSPMAISIIFGLLFATIILLIFVPVILQLLFKEKSN